MASKLKNVSADILSRLHELKKSIEVYEPNLTDGDKEHLETLKEEYYGLTHHYDWSNLVFEENGKKGLKDVEGNILIPAVYDGFESTETLFSKSSDVVAKKGDKSGLARCDGKGTPSTEFIYQHMQRIPYSNIYIVTKPDNPSRFALLENGQLLTPFELETFGEICDGALPLLADGKQGMLAIELGNIYVRPEYDDIYDEGMGEEFIFVKDGIEGKVTLEGHFISNSDIEAMTCEEENKLAPNGYIYAPDSF